MRRILVLAITALVALVAASAANAAINTYTAPFTFTSKKAGTVKKPAPIGFTENITATGTGGNRTALLTNIKTKIYGLKVDGKDFPTCSFNKIANAHNDNVCPKGAMIANGSITAVLGLLTNFSTSIGGTPCNPDLHVWNSGQGKMTFFFVVVPPNHVCGGLITGSTGPYPATYKTQGKYDVTNVPIPNYINLPAPGVSGSLVTEHLVWSTHHKKVHGKTVSSVASVGCLKGKRPFSTQFTANLPTTHVTETDTVKGSAKC